MSIRRALITLAAIPAVAFAGFAAFVGFQGLDTGRPSVCHGDINRGSLENGRRPPLWGDNYRAYSTAGYLAGRTFAHSAIRHAIVDAYDNLARSKPELRFVYAEGGWPWGGSFAPHKSHANGTAFDFHVPVRTLEGQVTELPTSPFNKLGYNVEFDREARAGLLKIDFDAMALHLLALDQAAKAHKIGIRRVIFALDLLPKLLNSTHGAQVRDRINFSKSPSWVRHDEHYHVDFDVPCK